MINETPSLYALLKQLQNVPYLASKSFYLVAEYFMNLDQQSMDKFCQALQNAKQNLDKCLTCWTWKEKTQSCFFCSSPKRNSKLICVVHTWRDLIAIERTSGYTGVYHVLGGTISPLDGIRADDLTINHLVKRVEGGCEEIVLALSQTPEGEATAAYLVSRLKNKDIKISCIASGLPVGSGLDSMDKLTISKALIDRRPY